MRLWNAAIAAQGFRADSIALLAGALAALALPPLFILPALLVAFPLLLGQINAAARPVIALRRGWWFGFGYNLFGLYWITEAILIEAARFWWLVPLAVPALSAAVAVYIAIPVWLAWFPTHRGFPGASSAAVAGRVGATHGAVSSCHATPSVIAHDAAACDRSPRRTGLVQPVARAANVAQVMTLAGGWVLADLARQFAFTGFPWNPLGSVWALPGYAGDVMLQPASLASVHGLTLLTVVLACAPALRWRERAFCLGGFLVWMGYGMHRVGEPPPPDQPLTVVLVQGNVPQGQKWDPALLNAVFDRYLRLTDEGVRATEPGARVAVVWPETASPFQLETDAGARDAIAAASHGATVLAGAVRFDGADRPRNSIFAVSGIGTTIALYDKWHLVPFGEYQPRWLPEVVQMLPGGGFAPGPGPATLHIPGMPPVGPLICYEAIFPGEVVDLADRPAWMVNVTNDAWFGTSTGPRQHLAAARLRAVEEGLPLLRVANTGITAAFDSRGHEIARLEMQQTGFRTVTLPGALPRTLFERFGLAIPGILAMALLALGLVSRQRRIND